MSRAIPFIPGASTLGLVFKDGVLLASERRVSYGYFIMSKSGRKVFKITENIGAACAGLIGDMQILVKEVSAYSSIYRYERGRGTSVRATAKMMGTLLFQRRLFPYLTQTIVGGVDVKGPSLYVLDPMGSVIKDQYSCLGSGAEIAVGVLEAEFRDDLTEKEAVDVVTKAMTSAVARDIASGDGADTLIIKESGVVEGDIPLKAST